LLALPGLLVMLLMASALLPNKAGLAERRASGPPSRLLLLPALPTLKLLLARSGLLGDLLLLLLAGMPLNATDLVTLGERAAAGTGVVLRLLAPAVAALPSAWLSCSPCSSSAGVRDSSGCREPSADSTSSLPLFICLP
jgi:hypothetical protein